MRIRFMRILVIFDLPQKEKFERKIYRSFIKFLEQQGYIRIQFSIFAKLCVHADVANKAVKKLKIVCPREGDVRYMVVTETQYMKLYAINHKYSIQEKITNKDRLLIIGRVDENN